MFKNYIKVAWRNLSKNKASVLINIFGLSIALSSCLVILIFVNYESNFDQHYKNNDTTYRVVQHTQYPNETLYLNTTAYPLAKALRDDFPEIDLVTQTAGPIKREFKVEDDNKNVRLFEEASVLFADSHFLKVFDTKWLAGNPANALEKYGTVILTAQVAQKYFGVDPTNYASILGKTILLNSKDPLVVTGVIENPSPQSNQRYTMLVPYTFFEKNNPYPSQNWSGNYRGTTFLVLKNKELKTALETKISNWKKKYLKPEDDKRISYFLQPLSEIHNETTYGSGPGGYIMPKKILRIAYIVAFFILIIAIVNFVNLITAQSASRSQEVGIRKVLGNTKTGLITQFIFENSLLIIITLGVALGISKLMINRLNILLDSIQLSLQLEWHHVGLIMAIGIITIGLAAIYPAFILAAFKPVEALKNVFNYKKANGFSMRKALVTFQFIIVQIFVVASIVIALQMNYFKNEETGFASEAVIITPVPQFSKLDVYRNSLLQNNSITEVSFGSGPPMGINDFSLGTNYKIPQESINEAKEAEMKIGDINYIDFYKLELLAGRNFTENKNRFDEFIVNEKLIKSYDWTPEEAIGKKLIINEGEATIVGVVKDFHNLSLQYDITPCVLLNWNAFQQLAFIKTSKNELTFIEDSWKDTFNDAVYTYSFLEDDMAREYTVERLVFTGFSVLSILAISIGSLGLLGLMSFITLRKAKEISIRKVLGANTVQNISFLSKEFILLIGLAFVIAAPLSLLFIKSWLKGFAYSIQLSPWMFLFGGIITLIIAIFTSSFHAVKAAIQNPIKNLKTE